LWITERLDNIRAKLIAHGIHIPECATEKMLDAIGG
jgi:hypothetical protein